MYGLPQAGILAQQLLEKRLNKQGCQQSSITPSFWVHKWRPISFTLCVDNFGVKYIGEDHADHLMKFLKEDYKISLENTGNGYLGRARPLLVLRQARSAHVHVWLLIGGMQALQAWVPEEITGSAVPARKYKLRLEGAVHVGWRHLQPTEQGRQNLHPGSLWNFFYHTISVDCSMFLALGYIVSQQSAPTVKTMRNVKKCFDYAATHPDAIIT